MPKRVTVTQRKPVSWLDPAGLAATGVKAVEAGLFGSFADRRETIAALSPDAAKATKPAINYAGKSEVWFDYIADTGDGWNASYAIACLSCADGLSVQLPDNMTGPPVELQPPDFTILGGDEVYPTASVEDYKTRLTDPYYCASTGKIRNRDERHKGPHVYALPGNHDWYDGLTSFMRLFLQGDRQVGPWMTGQERTYFAIKLPHHCWIWGVDVQLESDLDAPQIDYFQNYANLLEKDDRVILCTPEPSWVEGADDDTQKLLKQQSKTHKNLLVLERLIIKARATIPLRIAGDLHHYARYQGADGNSQLVTCGGGGAFMHSTHTMPPSVDMTNTFGQSFRRECLFPSIEWCKKKRWSVFGLIFKNPGFAILLGIVYALYAWILESASVTLVSYPTPHLSLLDYLAKNDGIPLSAWWDVVKYSPLGGLFTLTLLWGPGKYAVAFKHFATSSFLPAVGGLIHGAAHLCLAVGLMYLAVRIPIVSNYEPFLLLFIAVCGIVAGSFLMAFYLLAANLLYDGHEEEVFSCQAIQDYKCFTRIKIAKNGITLYPIGLKTVPRKWRVAPGVDVIGMNGCLEPEYELMVADSVDRIFLPDSPDALQPRLIERPFTLT